MKGMRALLLAAVVMTAMAGACASASASRGIRITTTVVGYGGNVTMNGSIICLNLIGITYSNTLLKLPTDRKSVTSGSISSCSGPLGITSAVMLTPIVAQYASFRGTLPNFTGINLSFPNFGFSVTGVFGTCLYGGNLTGVTADVGAGGAMTSLTLNTNALPRVSGSALCPASATLVGRLMVLQPGSQTATLI